MGTPHNTKCHGETWNPADLATVGAEIEAIRDLAVVPGGPAVRLV